MTARMYMVAAAVGYAAYLGLPPGMLVGVAVLAYGVVRLNWAITLAMGVVLYAWRKGHRPLLIMALGCTYALAFGLKLGS